MNLLLAKVSRASYFGVKPLKRLGFNKVVKFRSGRTGTRAYLAINDSERMAVLVFRGTEKDGRDILTDISFWKEKYRGVRVHSGFLRAYDSIRRHIDKEVSKLPSDYELHATGHSLGSALACLYTMYGVRKPDTMVGFGSPRVGDKAFSDNLSKLNCTIYINHADVVPRVPRIGYRQPKNIIYMTSKGELITNPTWFSMFVDRSFFLVDRFLDHKIQSYIDSLEE